MVKIILKDVDPTSIKVSEGNASIIDTRNYGNLTLVDLKVNAPRGDSIVELEAKPALLPLKIECKLQVNSKTPRLSYFKNYEFINLSVNDSIRWYITIANNEIFNEYTRYLIIPALLSVELNSEFIDIKEISPPPNSTTAEGTYSWALLVSNVTTISISAKIKNFSDWGVISFSPFTLSYSSSQLGKVREILLNANQSLNSYLTFLSSSYTSANESLNALANFKNELDLLADSLRIEGEFLQSIRKNLTLASKNFDGTVSQIDVIISLVNTLSNFLSTSQVEYFINNLPQLLQEAKNSLQEISSSQASDIEQLLELNQTLSYVYYYTINDSLKQRVQDSINVVNNLIKNARQRQRIVNNSLVLLSNVNAEELKNTLSTIRNQVLQLSSALPQMKSNLLSFRNSLTTLGNALGKAGEMNIEQSNAIMNATINLENQINSTKSQLNELMNRIGEIKKAQEKLKNEIKSLENKQAELSYTSPEVSNESYLAIINGKGYVYQQNITQVFRKNSVFVQYLILYNNSDGPSIIPIFNFVNETNKSLLDLNGILVNVTLDSPNSYIVVISRLSEANTLEEDYFANIVQYDVANSNAVKNQFSLNTPEKREPPSTSYQYLFAVVCIVAGIVIIAMHLQSATQREKRRRKLNQILSKISQPRSSS
jgi:predicted  nucleic acid-binding Zn-ribbon protein